MKWRVECPRCGKAYTLLHDPRPINCGDCLMQDLEIVKMIVKDADPQQQMQASNPEHKPRHWWLGKGAPR